MNAVVTIAIGDEFQKISELTHPLMIHYADSMGADFIVIDTALTTPHFEKFAVCDLLKHYKRIAYFDTDLVIKRDCPNLFDIVPYDKFGAYEEGVLDNRSEAMKVVAMQYKEELKDWNGKYFNTGVMILSEIHKELFKRPEKEHHNLFEQSYINLKLALTKTEVYSLDEEFNALKYYNKEGYINHYAGVKNRYEAIRKDLENAKI